MSLPHILLGMLECGEPMSGYELKKEFNEGGRHYWHAELSQIYPTLKKLEEQGFLESSLGPSARGPERRAYSVTETGREELQRWILDGPEIGKDRLAYLAQVLFMGVLEDLEESEHFLISMREGWSAKAAMIRDVERQMLREAGPADQLPDFIFHQHAALRLGIAMLEAKLNWADETIAAVRARLTQLQTVEA